ncbi:MAG: hypothetical protein ABH871_05135 [Pseudomonadota bacterium]
MAFEYLFTSLPALPRDPGGAVSLSAAKLASLCSDEGGTAALLTRALLFSFDIKALEQIEFGVDPSETALFDEKQLRQRENMPHWLKSALDSDGSAYSYPFDRVWEAYFRRLMKLACSLRSQFLMEWVSWEVGLRNALAAHRAMRHKALGEPLQIKDISKEYAYEFRPVIDTLISLVESGAGPEPFDFAQGKLHRRVDSYKEMDRTVNMLKLAKARDIAPEYTFNLDELLSYVVQFSVIKQGGYLS